MYFFHLSSVILSDLRPEVVLLGLATGMSEKSTRVGSDTTHQLICFLGIKDNDVSLPCRDTIGQ